MEIGEDGKIHLCVFAGEHRTRKGTLTPASEALLRTISDGQQLEMTVPRGGDDTLPPLVTFLCGVFFRAEEDPSFIPEMAKWIEDNWPDEMEIN